MAEYIEREAALKVLCDACGNAACPKGLIPRCSYYEKMQSIPAADVVERASGIIGVIPAADVRPVVRAHWIKCNRGAGYKCSACKARSSCADVLNGNHKFCYKCGAMMEES